MRRIFGVMFLMLVVPALLAGKPRRGPKAIDPLGDAALATDSRYLLAQSRLQQGRWRIAADLFRQVIDDRPSSWRAQAGLGEALAGMGRCSEALPYLAAPRGRRSWGAEMASNEAWCFMRVGDLSQAVAVFQEAAFLNRRHAETWTRYGRTLLIAGEYKGAASALRRLRASAKDRRDSTLLGAELALETDRSFDEAYAQYDQYARTTRSPRLVVLSMVLDGRRWLDLGDVEEGVHVLEQAVTTGLANIEAAIWRAEALRRSGDTEGARFALSRPMVREQEHPQRAAVLARILVDEGEPAEAIALLEKQDRGAPEILASLWYAAHAEGSEKRGFWRAIWNEANENKLRSLEQLLPETEGRP